jgi:hypothetical protein
MSTVINPLPIATPTRNCWNTTLNSVGSGFRQIGSWMSETTRKVLSVAKPFFIQLGQNIKLASAIVWNNTRSFFVSYKKELGLVALGAALVGLIFGVVKTVQHFTSKPVGPTAIALKPATAKSDASKSDASKPAASTPVVSTDAAATGKTPDPTAEVAKVEAPDAKAADDKAPDADAAKAAPADDSAKAVVVVESKG